MKWQRIILGTVLVLAGLFVVRNLSGLADPSTVAADSTNVNHRAPAPEPVEDSMHEFMEYVFQPTFLRLKANMGNGTKDNAVWKAVKSDTLILAESGNLLLMRVPEKDASSWAELSASVRSLGGELYQAARAKNETAAQTHYRAMITQCNRCHNKFADGEHQLAP